jgi:hypothetical protein
VVILFVTILLMAIGGYSICHYSINGYLSQPHFEGNVRLPLTLSKMGVWNPPRLLKTQKKIAGVKTPRIEVFFTLLESS